MRRLVTRAIAWAFLDGEWERRAMSRRARETLGLPGERWTGALAARVLAAFPRPPADRAKALADLIDGDSGFDRAFRRAPGGLRPVRLRTPAPALGEAFDQGSDLPRLDTAGALADWLGLGQGELEWFADRRGQNPDAMDEGLRHYRARWIEKRGGGLRLLEAPKPRLRELQRRLLRGLIGQAAPDEAAQGFVAGRSPLTHAALHSGKRLVLRLDLEDFFASLDARRVRGVLRGLGYPGEVSSLVAALCTTKAPRAVLERLRPASTGPQRRQLRRLSGPHLPQGAPTSPALANLCARRLDRRLAALASRAGEVGYSRYADDLTFSGGRELERRLEAFLARASAIAIEEGFFINHRKTLVMRAGGQQRVTGLVVNERPNLDRRELDRLRALLHNCAVRGPGSQNREGHADFRAHLAGRVAWVEQVAPRRGARLRQLLEAIDWPANVLD